MQQQVKILCNAFQRNPDGSWTSIRNSDIQTPSATVRINPGILFKKGMIQWGIDIVKALEESCADNNNA